MMLVNNETGVIQDVASLAKIAKQHGALVHTDAVQALGKIPLNFNELGVDAMTLSSHKIYGPQGAGALVLDKRVDIQPLLHGGGQERGRRGGTEAGVLADAFALALRLSRIEEAGTAAHAANLGGAFDHALGAHETRGDRHRRDAVRAKFLRHRPDHPLQRTLGQVVEDVRHVGHRRDVRGRADDRGRRDRAGPARRHGRRARARRGSVRARRRG